MWIAVGIVVAIALLALQYLGATFFVSENDLPVQRRSGLSLIGRVTDMISPDRATIRELGAFGVPGAAQRSVEEALGAPPRRRMMTSDERTGPEVSDVKLFLLAAGVFAEREGRILILKRGEGGAMSGAWDVPGGVVDDGETPEEAARRELREEAGLEIGPLELIGIVPMFVYGHDAFRVMYAGTAGQGEATLSAEHTGARWIDPKEYRDRYFGKEQIERVAGRSEAAATMVRSVRDNLDQYIANRSR